MSEISNCVQCVLRPLNKLGFILFSSSVFHCSHFDSVEKGYIDANFSSKLFIIFLSCLIFTVHSSVNKIIQAEYFKDVFYDVVALLQTITAITLLSIFRRHYNNLHSSQLTILMRLVENRKYFGVKCFLTEKFTNKSRKNVKYFLYYFMSHTLLFIIYNFHKDPSLKNGIYQIGKQLGLSFDAFFIFYGLQLVKIYEKMFQSLTSTIEYNLKRDDQSEAFSKLNNLLLLYLKLKKNYFTCLPSVMTVFGTYVFFASATIILAALFIYLFNFNNYYNGDILLFYDYFVLNIFFFYIDAYYMAKAFTSVESKTHNVVIILKKYPLSKLTALQASQIELLTDVLSQEALIIKMGSLEFGVGVLTSVADNALAYFFVVLQFIHMFE